MYKKYLIIAGRSDKAGMNIVNQLSKFHDLSSALFENKPFYKFDFVEGEIIYTENLDLGKINEFDFIIFASKHKSEKREKSISIHAPGNFRSADLGGEPGKISPTSALFQKSLFENLNKQLKKHDLKQKYQLTLECTHHGPLISKPCVFVEIGSTEIEWQDRTAGFAVARAIYDTIKEFQPSPYREVAIGLGGPHYCPNFSKIQLYSNIAISHIIPEYIRPITKEMILEAWKKTQEDPDFILLDWKGLGKSEQRHSVIDAIEELKLPYKKTSQIQNK